MAANPSVSENGITHTPGPWEWDGKFTVTIPHAKGATAFRTNPEDARLIAAAPELLDDARLNDAAFTWLAEQMNSITDNAKHWNVAQIEALAQDLRVGIERNQKRTRAAIAKAEGVSR